MNTGKKVAFHTLGCKLNYSETSTIGRLLEDNGYTKVPFPSPADVYVINTCSVTENADKECKQIVRQALHVSPDAFIAIIGCYAQLKPNEIATIEGVDLVLGAAEKFKLLHYLDDLTKKEQTEIHACEIEETKDFKDAYSFGDRTRAFLKVQDGCDYNCAFCTIPLARGSSRSDTIENVVKNAVAIAARGIKEIVLTGVNIGDFGKQLDETGAEPKFRRQETFTSLVSRLDEVEGIERIRISSIEPNLLKDEIIEQVAQSKCFVPHFHIPLQSGSNKLLKTMHRRYNRELYAERIGKIKSLMPHCCIGVDVIVGFPGETDDDFWDTYRFLNELNISYLHVFTYSERANTPAIELEDKVPMEVRKKRNKMLRILSAKKQQAFYQQHIGQVKNVLFEAENKNGMMTGFTENYIKVKTPFHPELVNNIRSVKLVAIDTDGNFLIEFINPATPLSEPQNLTHIYS